jgi:anti-sigma B factor antagonist
MTKPVPALSVAVVEHTAFIKVPGRANFNSSIDFKTLVTQLRERSFETFVLDLGECVTMDSTFLGVLSGLALKHADDKQQRKTEEKLSIELLNPNARITDLLESLGVSHLFKVRHEECPCTALFEPVANNRPAPGKDEISQICLEAHEDLIRINPGNTPKFKDVTQFLLEDLKKCKENGEQKR